LLQAHHLKGRAVFGISGLKLGIILIAALILIGPEKLPEIARTLGTFLRMFNAAKEDMEKTIKADMFSVEETKSAITGAGTGKPTGVASSLYSTPADDEDEEGEEE
jgi:Sec-independent protein translocase protein TatA